VREFVTSLSGRIHLEYLPAYSPELNPVEYIWGYCKQHEWPNLCLEDFAQLTSAAHRALRRMRRRPTLAESFWKQAAFF
jgi:transposase